MSSNREKDSGLSSGALPSPEAKEKRGSQKRRQKERPVRQEREERESSVLEADEYSVSHRNEGSTTSMLILLTDQNRGALNTGRCV